MTSYSEILNGYNFINLPQHGGSPHPIMGVYSLTYVFLTHDNILEIDVGRFPNTLTNYYLESPVDFAGYISDPVPSAVVLATRTVMNDAAGDDFYSAYYGDVA